MKLKNFSPLNATPVTEEVISAERFLRLSPSDRAKIKSTHVVPPQLGKPGFGGVLVRYKNPIYKVG